MADEAEEGDRYHEEQAGGHQHGDAEGKHCRETRRGKGQVKALRWETVGEDLGKDLGKDLREEHRPIAEVGGSTVAPPSTICEWLATTSTILAVDRLIIRISDL